MPLYLHPILEKRDNFMFIASPTKITRFNPRIYTLAAKS